jgi:hypothetical protein
MKKVVVIVIALFFLAVSCQKEVITPNADKAQTGCLCDDGKTMKNPGDDGAPVDTITDPNGDEDEQKKPPRKGKK